MHRFARIVLAGLLCSTALPGAAHADPITAFAGGLLNAAGAATWLASGAVGAWNAGFAVGQFLTTTLVGKAVLAVGLSAASKALQGRPPVASPSDRLVNYAQPISYMERGYGRVRKGGPICFTGFTGNWRHYGVLIAAHRTLGPVEHWLDKREVELDGSNNVTTAPYTTGGTAYAKIRAFRGLPGQAAYALWVSNFPEITAAHDFAGLSYGALAARRPPGELFDDLYPSGREPVYAPVWDMNDRVFDPRSATYGWTDNAALIIAAEAEFHGKAVDWDEVAEEANHCGVLVTNAEGGTQAKWTLNGVFDDSQSWEVVRDQMAIACDAWFYERSDGKVGFKVGGWTAPELVLRDDDFLSLTLSEGASGPDTPGQFSIKYVDPARGYLETPSGAYVLDAGAGRSEQSAWLVNSHNQASRIAKRLALKARPKYALRGTIKIIGYEAIGQRFVRVISDQLGINRVFEVDRLVREAGGRTFTIEGSNAASADFDFVAATEEPDRPVYAEVISEDDIPDVTGFDGMAISGTGGVAQIEWFWDAQDLAFSQEVRFRRSPQDWQIASPVAGQNSLITTGLLDGGSYDAQVRNKTSSGRLGDWSPMIARGALANSTPPGALSLFAASLVGADVAISWRAPNSAVYFATRVFRGPTTSFGAASLIHTEYGIPSASDGWDDLSPPSGTWRYWAEAINASGVAGPLSGPLTVTVP
jgi:hypothetical protein